jgi:hypothetical protein
VSESDPGHVGALFDDGLTGRVRLVRDGRLVAELPTTRGELPMVEGAAAYRLTLAVDRVRIGLPLSTRTRTTWGFTSSAAQPAVPLLEVDYGLPVDLTNTATGDPARPVVGLRVARHIGSDPANVTAVRHWLSTDDGRTWTEATVTRDRTRSGRWEARLPGGAALRPGSHVSLRTMASDDGGSSVDQVIIRAYQLPR